MKRPTNVKEEAYNLAIEYFEQDCEIEADSVCATLCLNNMREFKSTGFDGMIEMVENDHEMHYIHEQGASAIMSATFKRGVAYHLIGAWRDPDTLPLDAA